MAGKEKPDNYTFGRPPSYDESFVQKAEEYLLTYKEFGDVVPTIEGFADFIGTSKKTIHNWMEERDGKRIASPDFLHAYNKIKNRQGRELQNGGLSKKFGERITALMLQANHGMKERSEISGDQENPINLNIGFERVINKVYGGSTDEVGSNS